MTLVLLLQAVYDSFIFVSSYEDRMFNWTVYPSQRNVQTAVNIKKKDSSDMYSLKANYEYSESDFKDLNKKLYDNCGNFQYGALCETDSGQEVYFNNIIVNDISDPLSVTVTSQGADIGDWNTHIEARMTFKLVYTFTADQTNQQSFSCQHLEANIPNECNSILRNIAKQQKVSAELTQTVYQQKWKIYAQVTRAQVTADVTLDPNFPEDAAKPKISTTQIIGICLIVLVVLMIVFLPISCIKSNKRTAAQNQPISRGYGKNTTWSDQMDQHYKSATQIQ